MAVITISRGSYSKGSEIAKKLADELGYDCVSRDILIEASKNFNIPEVKLVRAIHDAPSILSRFTYGKERYIAYAKEALLEHVSRGNMVYHGLAGHFFLQGIPNILKVRIIANINDRVREEMKREGISKEEAYNILKKDDSERRKWGLALYGQDTWDSNLYDMVLHVDNMSVDDAVDVLADMARHPCFQIQSGTQKILDDMLLAARVQVLLTDQYPRVDVTSDNGIIYVDVKTSVIHEANIEENIKELIKDIKGAKDIKLSIIPANRPD